MALSQHRFNVVYPQSFDACLLQYTEAANSEITDEIALLNSVCKRRHAGWMTCGFNALLNSISIISGRRMGNNERPVQWNLVSASSGAGTCDL